MGRGPFHWWASSEDDEVMRGYFYQGALPVSKELIFVSLASLRKRVQLADGVV